MSRWITATLHPVWCGRVQSSAPHSLWFAGIRMQGWRPSASYKRHCSRSGSLRPSSAGDCVQLPRTQDNQGLYKNLLKVPRLALRSKPSNPAPNDGSNGPLPVEEGLWVPATHRRATGCVTKSFGRFDYCVGDACVDCCLSLNIKKIYWELVLDRYIRRWKKFPCKGLTKS